MTCELPLSKFDETRSIEGGDKLRMDKKDSGRLHFHRLELLVGAAYLMLGLSKAHATIIVDHLPWTPNAGDPPTAALPGSWVFFTGDEGRAMEAIADRFLPPRPADSRRQGLRIRHIHRPPTCRSLRPSGRSLYSSPLHEGHQEPRL